MPGLRVAAGVDLHSRQARDLTAYIPDVVVAVRECLPPGTVVDGDLSCGTPRQAEPLSLPCWAGPPPAEVTVPARHRRCTSKYTVLPRRYADRLMPNMIAVGIALRTTQTSENCCSRWTRPTKAPLALLSAMSE